MNSSATIDKCPSTGTEQDPRWRSVVARDPKTHDAFVYSVTTTGVYCRPSCGAKLARPEHVRFHMTAADAERAGFRPCKRCKPNQSASETHERVKKVEKACRLIEQSEDIPSLGEIARHVGLSAHHFHRTFKAITGLTPKEYASAHRCKQVRASLETSATVTNALYDAGYASSGRFYEISDKVLGMTPSTFRAGGADTNIVFAIGECSLGSILVAQSKKGVCSISLGDDPSVLARAFQDRFPKANVIGNKPSYQDLVAKVVGLIERPDIEVALPLDIRGTIFQRRVWKALIRISPGSTVSYSDIAAKIGMPKAARAVARACATNDLAVAIPCHRVVKNNGSLASYRWGIDRKRALLTKEARLCRGKRGAQ